METPGFSIFQGGDSIQIEANGSRIEEEEALEDQKRRHEELGNQLQNAFDDLLDDDDYTQEASINFHTHLCNGSEKASLNAIEEIAGKKYESVDCNKLLMENEQLKHTIELKSREIENLVKIIDEERKKNNDLSKKLALSEAEKARAHMSRSQTHELLVESKAKESEQEDCINKLKIKLKSIESANNELTAELEKTKTLLSDAQHKYHYVEKNIGLTNEKNLDYCLKQTNERNAAQIDMMQQQIDNLREKLENKESEFRKLDIRYNEIQRSREALLIEKSDAINQLARSLEESQKHCHELIAKNDYSQEKIKLQHTVKLLENQVKDMEKTITNLTAKIESREAELKFVDSIICDGGEIVENLRRLSLSKGNFAESTPFSTSDRLSHLKNELLRSIASQKSKREENQKLQEEIALKNEEIKRLKDDENNALVQLNMYKEENIRLDNRIKIIEKELQKKSINLHNNSVDLTKQDNLMLEVEEMTVKNNLLEKEISNIKKEVELFKEKNNYLKTALEEAKIDKTALEASENKCQHLQSKINTLNTQLEDFQKMFVDLKSEKAELHGHKEDELNNDSKKLKLELEKCTVLLRETQQECNRLKSLYCEVSAAKDKLSTELRKVQSSDLNKEFYVQREKCAQLERALQLAEMKSAEICKLNDTIKFEYEKEIKRLQENFEKDKTNILKTNSDFNDIACSKCIALFSKVTKLEIQNITLQNQCSFYIKEISNKITELQEAKHLISELNDKINLRNESEKIILELKEKAQKFEDYIKNQSKSTETSGISSPKATKSLNKSVETSPDLEGMRNYSKIEKRIRTEMEKIYETKMKMAEDEYKKSMCMLETNISELKMNLQQLLIELDKRTNEISVLKHVILAERNSMQNQMTDSIRNSELKIAEWEHKFHVLRDETQKLTEELHNKYISAKKTAANYKKYSEDKEKHLHGEYIRIKSGYEIKEKQWKDVVDMQNMKIKQLEKELSNALFR